jgi:hypothetical protein
VIITTRKHIELPRLVAHGSPTGGNRSRPRNERGLDLFDFIRFDLSAFADSAEMVSYSFSTDAASAHFNFHPLSGAISLRQRLRFKVNNIMKAVKWVRIFLAPKNFWA